MEKDRIVSGEYIVEYGIAAQAVELAGTNKVILKTDIMDIIAGDVDMFDPEKHEIRGFEYRDDVPEDTIVEVLREGYVSNSEDTKRESFEKVPEVDRHRERWKE